MELSEMEKRMLYPVEGSNKSSIVNELAGTMRYETNPVRKETTKNLMKKLRPLSDAECMDIVRDIQQNYQLPREGRTVGEMLAEARRKSGTEKLKGHDIMALERFDPDVKHMITFKVLSNNFADGSKGDRMRLFLTENGYQKFLENQKQGQIRINNHAKVTSDGHLHYDHQDREL